MRVVWYWFVASTLCLVFVLGAMALRPGSSESYAASSVNICPFAYIGVPGDFGPALIWEKGKLPGGFEGELVQALYKAINCKLILDQSHPNDNPVTRRFDALKEGTAHMSIMQFTVTKERKEQLSFSQPYASDGVALLVSKDNPAKSIAALQKLAKPTQLLVANDKTTGKQWAMKTFGSSFTIVNTAQVPDTGICIREGRCLGFAGDRVTLQSIVAKKPWLRILEDGPYTKEQWAIAFPKKARNPHRLWMVNKALKKMEENGSLAALRKKWGMLAP